MPNELQTGVLLTSTMPQSLRDYYSAQLLNVLRSQTVFQQLALEVEDFAAVKSKQIILTKVFDLHPCIGTLQEAVPWLKGAHLNSRQYSMTIAERGNTMKFNRYHVAVDYWNDGNMQGLVRERLGRNLKESAEILARNAYLDSDHNANIFMPNDAAAWTDLTVTDVFIPYYASLSRTNLESRNAVALDAGEDPICVVHPRVGFDIREGAGSKWVDAINYADPRRRLRGEIGTLDGVRYLKNNFCRLANAGAVVAQTTLSADMAAGEGGPDSDEITGYTTYIDVTDSTDFAVGMEVAIHDDTFSGAVLGGPCPIDDPQAEQRVIIAKEAGKLYFSEPLGTDHATGSYVTEARDLYASIQVAGPSLVYGVAIQPGLVTPPVIDDAMRIFRLTWYGIFGYQIIQDDQVEVWITAASTANHGEA